MLIRFIAPKSFSSSNIVEPDSLNQRKLTLIYLAALIPKEHNVEVFDEDIDKIKLNENPDLVCLSFNSHNSDAAYKISAYYRKIKIPVICGGFHASLFPQETLKYFDAVIIGESEELWEEIIDDINKNKLKKIYKSSNIISLNNLPTPRYDLYNTNSYYKQFPVFATRGCPYNCNFCCIKMVYGKSFRKRPVKDVVRDIEFIKDNYDDNRPFPLSISFVDDNIWGDKKYAMELFKALESLNIQWYAQGASINTDIDVLESASKSGCILLFIGFESLNSKNLLFLNKKQNDVEKYSDFINKLHNLNIAIGGYFIVGLPYDKKNVFDELKEYVENHHIECPKLMIYKLIPGTKVYKSSGFKLNGYSSMIENLPLYTPSGISKNIFRNKYVEFHKAIYNESSIKKRLIKTRNIALKYINKKYQEFYNNSSWQEWIKAVKN